MFKRIVVPLDGSERAESAIPLAARIAHATEGAVKLIQVVTHPLDTGTYLVQPVDLSERALGAELDRATEYLNRVAKLPVLTDVKTEIEVYTGLPAPVILAASRPEETDMIVMCSHGDTGFKRWVMGSVAQKVARHSQVPVLVLREGGVLTTGDAQSVRILVALDGSPLAEAALLPAAQLSMALSAPAKGALHLMRVLPIVDMESFSGSIEAKTVEDVKAYLEPVATRLREDSNLNVSVTFSVAADTDIASTIIGMAESGEFMEKLEDISGCDMIAMATHGRGGPQRWVMGSVTERVLGATKLPLFIIRPTTAVKHEQTEVAESEKEKSWVGLL